MTDQLNVREAFEVWFKQHHGMNIGSWHAKWNDGEYVIQEVQYAWEGWQAALAHASSADVKESLIAHSSSDFDELHDLAKRLDDLQSIVESGQRVEFAKSLVGNGVEIGVRSPCRVVVADNLREAIDQAIAGCHLGSRKPLGRLANAQLRAAKMAAHAAFDPLWKRGQRRRGEAYGWLAAKLGIDKKRCHIGMFDVDMCLRVIDVCSQEKTP